MSKQKGKPQTKAPAPNPPTAPVPVMPAHPVMDLLSDLISVSEAARLLPSPVAGKQTHPRTIRRLIGQGRLTAYRRDGNLFVRRSELAGLFKQEERKSPTPPREDWRIACRRLGIKV